MAEEDKTVRMVTNLDRKAIEGKLAEVRKAAQAANLNELASMLQGVEGMPKAQIEMRVKSALMWLSDKPQHQRMTVDLELVELNLKNLK
ncbi:MAG TPA: hypothetical protein VLI89_00390 [Burkholderiales bacterium]|nr:hypothetical protein [Burkholderiales bacterium]